MLTLTSDSFEKTQAIAASLAPALRAGDVITLVGDLGAGKTAFAKGLVAAFAGITLDEVTSPTFTLCQEYRASQTELMLYHYDLYRLEHEGELQELGLEEQCEHGAVVLEWPEIAQHYLPENRLEIAIQSAEAPGAECGYSENIRCIQASGPSHLLDRLMLFKDRESA